MGTITFLAPSASAQVPVTFAVGANGLTANPSTLTFNLPQNYGFGAPQTIQVTSTAATSLQAFGASDSNWLVVDTPNANTPASIVVRANDSSLPQGTYSGTVTIQSSPTNQLPVPVTLNIGPPATLQLAPASLAFSYTLGGPVPAALSTSVKSLTGAVQTFTVTTTTNDGAAWLMAAASGPTPGQVLVSVNPANLNPGSYTGIVNVTPSAMGASPQPISISLNVLPPPTPLVSAVVSSASYAGGMVAPGEFVTLFGSTLGPASLVQPPAGTFPRTLGGTVVMFDNIAAPILYASATQTSVQVPYGIGIGNTILTVQRAGVTSTPMAIASVPAFPGLFTVDSSGKGQIAALNQDLTLNSPSNPAPRGSAIILYGTGEGATNPASLEGAITPSAPPFPQTSLPVSVSFQGAAAVVSYFGETPSTVSGLLQINAVVPMNSPTGPAVPLQVNINGVASQAGVTVAIQ
jgi:uncharacterized protein (TIGR03437 family)